MDAFQKEYEVITEGQRSAKWVNGHKARIRLHLTPFFGKMGLSQVTAGAVQDYRVERIQNPASGKKPAYSTLHDEIVTLRLVLKTAIRKVWLDHLPDLSALYRQSGKITHRAWFSPDEYKNLYMATRANIKKKKNKRHKYLAEQLHDKILFMANTGIRPTHRLPEFIEQGQGLIAALGDLRLNCFGHLGDGNLHYNVFPPKGQRKTAFAHLKADVASAIYDLVDQFDGSVSAEHGVGRLKTADLARYGDPVKLAMMRGIKQALDPVGILNPGAVVPL